jgi:CRISPR-associated protein Cmr4
MTTRLVLVHALSPLHAGTGQSVGAIDLPIARERPTGIPLLPGSSIKGALRARGTDAALTRDVFGPPTEEASEHGGAVQFSDAHLVLLPVRSVAGVFAWVTSPYLLGRFARDASEAGIELAKAEPAPGGPAQCTVLAESLVIAAGETRRVVLEDLDFTPVMAGAAAGLRAVAARLGEALFPAGAADGEAWRQALTERLCLVHDDVMGLLLETATEVVARIRLKEDTKTVATGGLWYEEALPAESVLAGLAVAADIDAAGRTRRTGGELLNHVGTLCAGMVQLGGKATVGRGSCLLRLAGGGR